MNHLESFKTYFDLGLISEASTRSEDIFYEACNQILHWLHSHSEVKHSIYQTEKIMQITFPYKSRFKYQKFGDNEFRHIETLIKKINHLGVKYRLDELLDKTILTIY